MVAGDPSQFVHERGRRLWVTHPSRPEFDAYLDGSAYAYLLVLHHVCILNEPLTLRDLRQEGPFRPPQSFRYIAPSDPAPLNPRVRGSSPLAAHPC